MSIIFVYFWLFYKAIFYFNTFLLSSFCRNDVGTWSQSETGLGLDFNSGMEGRLDMNPKRDKYKIVTVHQPPFMYYNEDTGTLFISPITAHIFIFTQSQIVSRVSSLICLRR